jgi:hypothetical protein
MLSFINSTYICRFLNSTISPLHFYYKRRRADLLTVSTRFSERQTIRIFNTNIHDLWAMSAKYDCILGIPPGAP